MACRIHNLGKHKLLVDLAGGTVMYVPPNQISPPIREELLYGNIHLPAWEAQGLVRRISAKMSEVREHETSSSPRAPATDVSVEDVKKTQDQKAKSEKKPQKTR